MESTIHHSNAACQTTDDDYPWVGCHQAVRPAALVQSAGCQPNYAHTQTGMKEGLIEVLAFVMWHATILSRLSIEDEIGGQCSTSYHSCAEQYSLAQVALRCPYWIGLLLICSLECILEEGR